MPSLPDAALISIIMPAYNCARYLSHAIQSVCMQTYPHWELILLDDASTDNTAEIVQPYLSDPRIQYIRLEKHPSSSAARVRNIGIQRAKGPLIAFLDADDSFSPDALQLLYQEMQCHPECMMVQGFYSSIDASGKAMRTLGLDLDISSQGTPALPQGFHYSWETLLNVYFPCILGTGLFRKALFEQIGTFSEQLTHSEDFDFYLRLFHHFPNGMRAIPAYTYQYRYNPTSLTKAEDQYLQQLNCHFKLLEALFEHSAFSSEIQPLRPAVYTRWFRLFARQQLNSNRPHLARDILREAAQSAHIPKMYFLQELLPLLFQSFLPPAFYQRLADVNRQLKQLPLFGAVTPELRPST